MKILSAAAAAAVLFVTAAHADSQPVAIRVSTDGLDLAKKSDVSRLRGRIHEAVAEACNPSDSYYAQLTPDHDCVQRFRSQTDAMVRQLAAHAAGERLVAN